MELRDVLIRPVITEKTTMLMEEGKYTFRVPLTANKVQIRQAVEKIFNVKVEKVATIRVLGKTKRMGRTQGKRSDYKKAIVTLKAGESIEFFECLIRLSNSSKSSRYPSRVLMSRSCNTFFNFCCRLINCFSILLAYQC